MLVVRKPGAMVAWDERLGAISAAVFLLKIREKEVHGDRPGNPANVQIS